ncbi:MAG: hypothetical protein EYC70_09485 [Planctomycetota bacterium]|nr:MAG: hypothetical protein EYC70_09485 [Planctomycetota bacterium]
MNLFRTTFLLACAAMLPAILSAQDFNGDGYEDLAIGSPYADTAALPNRGVVHVLWGAAGALNPATATNLRLATAGLTPAAEDYFGWALAHGDLDADGMDDLVVGTAHRDSGGLLDSGLVTVFYGPVPTGGSLSFTAPAALLQAEARFGATLAVGDFDADGNDDLAVGAPAWDEAGIPDAGAVAVYLGPLAAGATPEVLTEASAGGTLQIYDHFGAALVAGQFNDDPGDELAVSVPYQDLAGAADAGVVCVFTWPGGVLAAEPTLDLTMVGLVPGAGDSTGNSALAAGDFDADGYDELAVGVPARNVVAGDEGCVAIFRGGSSGLMGLTSLSQDYAGMNDACEWFDWFGHSLAVGEFNGLAGEDLAVGVPREGDGAITVTGAVQVIYGQAGVGLSGVGDVVRFQPVGEREASDLYGFSIAAVDLYNDGRDDLAAAAPYEDSVAISNLGAVSILPNAGVVAYRWLPTAFPGTSLVYGASHLFGLSLGK